MELARCWSDVNALHFGTEMVTFTTGSGGRSRTAWIPGPGTWRWWRRTRTTAPRGSSARWPPGTPSGHCTVGYCWRVDMESSPAFPSLPSASVMFLLVCQGSPYMSRAGCIIRISIRKMIGSPSSQKPVMRQLGHPRNEFNLPWSSPLDEP